MKKKPIEEKIFCPYFKEDIQKNICDQQTFLTCEKCGSNPEKSSAKLPQITDQSLKKQQKTIPPPEYLPEMTYCFVVHQKIIKERCRQGKYPKCEKCLSIPPEQRWIYSSIFLPFTEDYFVKIENLLKISRFDLSLEAISKLIYCKDLLIMSVQTIEAKQPEKSKKIRAELEKIHNSSYSLADSLANLLGIPPSARPGWKSSGVEKNTEAEKLFRDEKYVRFSLSEIFEIILGERQVYQQTELKIKEEDIEDSEKCPYCEEKHNNLLDHLKLCHQDRVCPVRAEDDFIERFYSDVCKIYRVAHRALKKIRDYPKKGGRPPNATLKIVVEKLSSLFKEITGRDPDINCSTDHEYTGPFYEFTELFLEQIYYPNPNKHDPEQISYPKPTNLGLGQVITLILKKQKEMTLV